MSASDDRRDTRLAIEKAAREDRLANQRRAGNPRLINPARDEVKRTQNNLPAPAQIVRPPRRVDPAPAGGTAIEIVVVDNGEFKTGMFFIDGSLSLVEE